MSDRPAHVLLVGGGNGAFRANRPQTRTTFLTLRDLLAVFKGLSHHARVIALTGDEPEADVIALARTIHSSDPFDSVAALGEPLTMLAARIADALDLPGVPSAEVVERIVDKERMRARLRETGVEDTGSQIVDSAEALAAFVGAGAPDSQWIVKPAAGAGSLGVSQVGVGGDFDAAFARAAHQETVIHPDQSNHRVIVEQFLSGPQFSVETVSQNGETTVIAITKKYSDPQMFVELGHVVPAPLDDADADAIREHTVRALAAIGITDNVAHTEVVLTPQGPRILETHARVGGDDICEMASIVSGFNISASSIDLALRESIAPRLADAKPSGTCEAVWFIASTQDGSFAGLAGQKAAQAVHPSVEVTELLDEGEDVHTLSNSDSRVAQVRASGASAEEAVSRARTAAAALTIRVAQVVPGDVGSDDLV